MDTRVQAALAIIRERPAHVTPSDLAQATGISLSHLSHLVKMETGRSVASHIRSQRVAVAAELLLLSNRSVKEIAFTSGFARASHFVQTFRREFGCTPQQYRLNASKR